MEKAYFSLPGFISNKKVYEKINNFLKTYPFMFRQNVEIEAIFGCPSNAIWNGGGYQFGNILLEKDLKEIKYFYNDICNIPIRLTFTNPSLEEKDLYDNYCNFIASYFHDGFNEVLVSTNMMADFISSKYPNYPIIKSIVGSENKSYDLDERFVRTVMARRDNKNWDLLNSIRVEDREKIEFLCNEICYPNCQYTYNHYKKHGQAQKEFNPDPKDRCYCLEINRDFPYRITSNRENYITIEDIFAIYMPLGYKHFKLSGRNDSINLIEAFSRYFILPEFQIDFRMNARQ